MSPGKPDIASIRHRLDEIDGRIREIRTEVGASGNWLCRAFNALRNNYGFISFLLLSLAAGYYALRYHVTPFHDLADPARSGALARTYTAIGDRMMAAGRWEPARAAFNEALTLDPRNERASYHGHVAQLLTCTDPAVVDGALAQLAMETHDDPVILFAQGIACTRRGQYRGAAGLFTRSVAADSCFIGARVNLGVVALRTGDHATYLEQARAVYALDSGFSIAVNNMAYACELRHDFREATRLYCRLDTIDHSAYTLWLIGGALLYRDPAAAAPFLGQAAAMLQQELPESAAEFGGEWPVGYVPADTAEVLSDRDFVHVAARTEKLACVLSSYAVADALTNNLPAAEAKLRRAGAMLKRNPLLRGILSRDMAAIAIITNARPAVRRWLEHASQSWRAQ